MPVRNLLYNYYMGGFTAVSEKEKLLAGKMAGLGVKESDIRETFIRLAGPGGQKVNKSSTCVYLKHLPTGIEVKCQQSRSQSLNRYIARQILLKKIGNRILGKLSSEQQEREKIRRQKRKRSKRAKLKMLEAKRRHSDIKKTRGTVIGP